MSMQSQPDLSGDNSALDKCRITQATLCTCRWTRPGHSEAGDRQVPVGHGVSEG